MSISMRLEEDNIYVATVLCISSQVTDYADWQIVIRYFVFFTQFIV